MSKFLWYVLGVALFTVASFSSSSHYNLQSYGVGSGGTNSTHSTTYTSQASTGEVVGGTSSSTNYKNKSGFIQAEQANVPPAPTLGNGGGLYYNKLTCILNNGGNPTDATFAIAISSNSFATTSYVQSDGTLGASPVFQTYSTWGGGSGTTIVGLAQNTTYEVKASAYTGKFTQSAYGPFASASTVTPSITFSLSPTSQNLGTLSAGSVVTGSNINFNFSTNANYGGSIYVSGKNSGLFSSSQNYTIAAVTGNLGSLSEGFGLQGVSASSPQVIDSPFSGSGNNVGSESSTSFVQIFSSTSLVSSGTDSANLQARISTTTPAASDYSEVLTFVAAASF